MAVRRLALTVIIGLLLQSCILYFFRDTDLGGWEFVGRRYFGDERSTALDLVETGDGTLVVSFVAPVSDDFIDGDRANFVYFDGSRWVAYAPPRDIGIGHDRIRAGLLDDGRFCFAVEWSSSQIAAWDGSAWESIPGPSGSEDLTCQAAAFATDGTLLVAFRDPMDDYRLSFYAYASGAWSLMGDPLGLPAADGVWLAMDGAGQGVVYHGVWGFGTDDEVVVYRENGAAWDVLASLPAGIGLPGQDTCRHALITSAADLYCVVIPNAAMPTSSVLLRYTGSGWEGIGGPLTMGDSYLVDVGFTPLGDIVAIVEDDDNWGEYSAYLLAGGSWQLLGIPGFSFGDAPFGGALQAGADGYLYVATIALGHDRRISTMRYNLSM